MSKLGNGGLLGNSADLNARRELSEQHPQPGRSNSTRSSAVGATTLGAGNPGQPLAGAGGLPGAVSNQRPVTPARGQKPL